LAVQKSDEKN